MQHWLFKTEPETYSIADLKREGRCGWDGIRNYQARNRLRDEVAVGEAKDRDGRGRPLPKWQGCRVVGDGDLFLMNWQSDDSLDGRYFGFLPASSVIGRAMPVWTWEG